MALTEEEIYQAMVVDAELQQFHPPEERLRKMARFFVHQIARTDPGSIEHGTNIIHPQHGKELIFLEYLGDTVRVQGFPHGDKSNGEVQFELPSDEIALAEYIRRKIDDDEPVILGIIIVPPKKDEKIH